MDERRQNFRRRISRTWEAAQLWILFAFGLLGTVLALSLSSFENGSAVALQAGDVAARDVLAPHELSYESEVLTDQARTAAEQAVADIYDPPDSAIARLQLQRLTKQFDRALLVALAQIHDPQVGQGFHMTGGKIKGLAKMVDGLAGLIPGSQQDSQIVMGVGEHQIGVDVQLAISAAGARLLLENFLVKRLGFHHRAGLLVRHRALQQICNFLIVHDVVSA